MKSALNFETEITEIEQNLRIIENFAKDLFDHFVDNRSVDDQYQKIGAQLLTPEVLQNLQRPIKKNTNVFITSVFFKDCVHTREIEDWITKIYTDYNNLILLSTSSHISHLEQLQKLSELNINCGTK